MTKKTFTLQNTSVWHTSKDKCTCTEFIRNNDSLTDSKTNNVYKEKDDATENNSEEIDRGYAWVILILCVTLQCFAMANLGSYGMLLVNIADATEFSTGFISWYGNLAYLSFTFTNLFTGPILATYGFRRVMLFGSFVQSSSYILTSFVPKVQLVLFTLGVMQGVGLACFFVCPAMIVSQWFRKYRSLALSCVASGQSVGLLFWSTFSAYLIDTYGWRGGVLLIGGFLLHGLILASLLHTPKNCTFVKKESSSVASILKRLANKDLIKNKLFMLFALGNFFCYFGHCTPQAMLPRKITDLGFTNLQSAFLVSISGFVGGVFRILIGTVADLKYFNKIFMTMLSTFLQGAITASTIFFSSYTAFAIYAALNGVFSGNIFFRRYFPLSSYVFSLSAVYVSMLTPVVLQVVDIDQSAQALAWVLVIIGIAISSVLSINGLMYDLFNDASFGLLLAGIMLLISSIFNLTLYFLRRKGTKEKYIENGKSTP